MKTGDRFRLTPLGGSSLLAQDVVVTNEPVMMGGLSGAQVLAVDDGGVGRRVCLFSDGDVRADGASIGRATPSPAAPTVTVGEIHAGGVGRTYRLTYLLVQPVAEVDVTVKGDDGVTGFVVTAAGDHRFIPYRAIAIGAVTMLHPKPATPPAPRPHEAHGLDDWRRKIAALRGEPAPAPRPATPPPGAEAARAMRLALGGRG